jgi:hypothetical protein
MKDNTELQSVFNNLFKYQVSQELRHRGDTKSFTADMGLFVNSRVLVETVDDDGNKLYERLYICRVIRFSGSGEQFQFREKELMTIEEYTIKQVHDNEERNQMQNNARQTEKEIYAAFGVTKDTHVYMKDEFGNVLKDKKFRPSGFSLMNEKMELSLTEVITTTEKVERERKTVTSKDQFQVIE